VTQTLAITDASTRPAAQVAVLARARGGPLRTAALTLGLWTLVGILTTQSQLFSLARTQSHVAWHALLAWNLLSVWLWAAFTPVMMWLARRFPVRRDTWMAYAPVHVLFALAFSLVDTVVVHALAPLYPFPSGLSPFIVTFVRGLFVNFASYLVIVAITYAADYAALSRERELTAAHLAAQLAEARLGALQSQLRPHFLFNTLNTIAEQVYTDPVGADRMITKLGALLRASFAVSDQELPLRDELELLAGYVDIVRVRFHDRVRVDVDVDDDALQAMVPSFLLQPLVENALRHGLEPLERGGRVEIAARRRVETIVVEVRDDGIGFTSAEGAGDRERIGAPDGIGLRNTRDRLRQLYGERASLVLRARVAGGTIAEVTLPYRAMPRRTA
jgi:two-component sensor histidine kinase